MLDAGSGIAHQIGNAMTYFVLMDEGKVTARLTVQHITREDAMIDLVKEHMQLFDRKVKEKLDDTNFNLEDELGIQLIDIELDKENDPNVPTDAEYGNTTFQKKPDVEDKTEGVIIIHDVLEIGDGGDGQILGPGLARSSGQFPHRVAAATD